MGSHHLSALQDRCVAICDADKNRWAKAAQLVSPQAKVYTDFRQLLEQKDVDTVIIATTDHWHGIMTIMACEAGKDVYCEKPARVTIAEGRAMVNAAKRDGRIIQFGSQGRSQSAAYHACSYVRNGMIGRVNRVHCWHYANPVGATKPDSDPPPELDYDA
jgi:predicted dehydrogenase